MGALNLRTYILLAVVMLAIFTHPLHVDRGKGNSNACPFDSGRPIKEDAKGEFRDRSLADKQASHSGRAVDG